MHFRSFQFKFSFFIVVKNSDFLCDYGGRIYGVVFLWMMISACKKLQLTLKIIFNAVSDDVFFPNLFFLYIEDKLS